MFSKMIVLAMLVSAQFLDAQPRTDTSRNFVVIPSYTEESHGKINWREEGEIQSLKARVKILEAATRQLQEEIYSIKYAHSGKPISANVKSAAWFCAVKSSFNRSYSGRGKTKLESRVNALDSCRKEDGIHCKEERVECEREFA
jgi:hypothetical protein